MKIPDENFKPSNLCWLRPWLEASIITLLIFWDFNLNNICPNRIGSIVVFGKLDLVFFNFTPNVPIEATFILLSFNNWK